MQSSLFASMSICYDVCLSQRTPKKHNAIRMVTKHDIFFKSNIYLWTKVKENIFFMKNRVIFYIFNYSTWNVLLLYCTLCYVHLFILYSEEFRSHFFSCFHSRFNETSSPYVVVDLWNFIISTIKIVTAINITTSSFPSVKTTLWVNLRTSGTSWIRLQYWVR